MQCCLDESHCRLICDVLYLHPGCTGSLDSLRSSIRFLSDFLGDCAWDTYLASLVTQEFQPAQISQKDQRRCIHHPYAHDAHGASSAAALSSAAICSSCKLMA